MIASGDIILIIMKGEWSSLFRWVPIGKETESNQRWARIRGMNWCRIRNGKEKVPSRTKLLWEAKYKNDPILIISLTLFFTLVTIPISSCGSSSFSSSASHLTSTSKFCSYANRILRWALLCNWPNLRLLLVVSPPLSTAGHHGFFSSVTLLVVYSSTCSCLRLLTRLYGIFLPVFKHSHPCLSRLKQCNQFDQVSRQDEIWDEWKKKVGTSN